jgi:hypothetical protein
MPESPCTKLHRVESIATVAMPRSLAWEKMRDFTAPVNYVPGVLACNITTDMREGVGASRRAITKNIELDETVVVWNEGYGFTIRLHDGDKKPPFFAAAYFVYAIADDNDKTRLTMAMEYRLPWGLFGRLLNGLLLRFVFAGDVRDITLNMKYCYETGNRLPRAELKRLKAELGL